MEMKKLLESLEECGMNEMPPMAPPVDKGQPVSMNVSLNASGKEHVEDLINMMKNAGLKDAEPVGAKMLAPRLDMERLRGIVDGDMDDPAIPGDDDVEGDQDLQAAAGTVNSVGDIVGDGPTDVDRPSSPDTTIGSKAQSMEDEMEGYENEPDVHVGDIEDVTPDGDDLHRSKDRKAIRTNDPALENIKADLYAALSEKKAKPDFLDVDKDGDKKEPMKKAIKDKGSKPKKGEVPPQFKK
jgi:hypothetical protein